ncbi:conjugal transfer protein TraG N-terminal domain-containing protein [Sphingomonas sp. Leaf4]|uniref:conjugal transfer protein TraG N-terminal domain-containing protein n=1 Tax=Sphingomonas sp. Leaf4 TaxID=2876553 RepID=UPI001E42D10E|nr:conjugal transfer protein TraG N-terminal domain-containing protein [Sphingomonas sp. Leaf4]
MVEVFTIGGGEYVVNVFNAVAAWTGGGGYRSLIRVAMVIGFIYAIISVAFTMNVKAWFSWYLGATAIYLCLMVPTIDVKVTDRINPSLAPATVANVPLGLGVIASFTSQAGDWLTRTAETVFVMPNQLQYSTNGMIYGSRLLEATRTIQIRDAEYATNLQAYFKNCLFPEILLRRKSMTVIVHSVELWEHMGPGSESLSQPWIYRNGDLLNASILTCRQAYNQLTWSWYSIGEGHLFTMAKDLYPRMRREAAVAKLRQDLPIVTRAFTGYGGHLPIIMRQSNALNAFMIARDGMASGSSSADTFATTRSDIQARNTYNSIAAQAMTWVPILNIVLTVVFYAMFPVIFPLFLLPQTGISALKGYVTGFFYLAAWGPLYVILHMICMSRAVSSTNSIAENGISLISYAGVGAVNAETATIAGFMLMSVPFIAGGLAKGAMGVAGHATSMLAPAQNAAEQAATEQTTGNYSYGNVSFANSTDNMRQTSQWSLAPTMTSGHGSYGYRTDSGTMFTAHDNGRMVIDSNPATAKLPFSVTRSSGEIAAASENATNAARIAKSNTHGSSEDVGFTIGTGTSITSALANASGYDSRSTVTSGSDVQTYGTDDRTAGTGMSTGRDASDRMTNAERGSQQFNLTRSLGGDLSAKWNLGGNSGGKSESGSFLSSMLPETSVSLSAAARGNWLNEYGRTQGHELGRGLVNSEDVRNGISLGSGKRYNTNDGTSLSSGQFASSVLTNTTSNTTSQQLDRNWRVTSARQELQEISDGLNREISYSQSNGMQMSENLSTQLQEWYMSERARNPGMGMPELHDQYTSPEQDMARNAAIGRFMSQRNDAVRGRISELEQVIETKGLADVAPRGVASRESVIGRYHGGGVGGPQPVAVAAPDRTAATQGIVGIAGVIRGARANQKQTVRAATSRQLEAPKDVDVIKTLSPF